MSTDTMSTDTLSTGNEAQAIGRTLGRLRQALHDRDAAAFAAACTPDLRVFDLDPPLQRRGAAGEAEALKAWFTNWQGPIEDDLHEMEIAVGGDVAFVTALSHLRATARDGEATELWSRVTFGLHRRNGAWRVAHRHASVPFHMDGSLRAAVTLKP